LIDNRIKIDFLKNKIVAEIKKSSKYIQSSKMQLLFYLYYLKNEKNLILEGELIIPDENKKIKVNLDSETEKEIEKSILDIENIIKLNKPPEPIKIPYCRKCAFKEICWS